MSTNFPANSFANSANNKLYPGYIGECTWYALGRAHETTGVTNLPTGNAGTWYAAAKNTFERKGPNEIPLSWSIGCFSGHVLFIESVYTAAKTTYITFSEANWYASGDSRLGNGQYEPAPDGTDGQDKTLTWEAFKSRSGGGTYQGSICLW